MIFANLLHWNYENQPQEFVKRICFYFKWIYNIKKMLKNLRMVIHNKIKADQISIIYYFFVMLL